MKSWSLFIAMSHGLFFKHQILTSELYTGFLSETLRQILYKLTAGNLKVLK